MNLRHNDSDFILHAPQGALHCTKKDSHPFGWLSFWLHGNENVIDETQKQNYNVR